MEDNRSRWERRAIATRPVLPEQMGLAGTQQLALVQRTRTAPAFVADNLSNPAALAAKLASPADELSKSLRAAVTPKVRKHLCPAPGAELEKEVPAALVRGLNKLAKGPSLCDSDPVRFPENRLSEETRRFREENPKLKGGKLARFNRLLLRDAYPEAIDLEPKPELDWLSTSREPDKMGPEAFLGNNRQYWGIENGTHQRLDCSALEDRLRIHDRNAVAVLGLFHRLSISLFMDWAGKQSSVRDRTYPTWQSDHDANRWLMINQVTKAPT